MYKEMAAIFQLQTKQIVKKDGTLSAQKYLQLHVISNDITLMYWCCCCYLLLFLFILLFNLSMFFWKCKFYYNIWNKNAVLLCWLGNCCCSATDCAITNWIIHIISLYLIIVIIIIDVCYFITYYNGRAAILIVFRW